MNAYQPRETQTYGYDNTCLSFDPTGTLIFGYDVPANWFTKYNFESSPGSAARVRHFTGKERDAESGLDYFGARYYGSALGRFTSPDEFKGGFDGLDGQAALGNLGTPHPFTEFEILPKPTHSYSMGRIGRVVAVGEAHHITHRGIAQQPIFHSEPARSTYLHLLGEQAARHKLRLLGYCLMTNHVHWLAVPEHPEALARTVRFVHGPYAQYVNTSLGRTGHFWQNRFYSCPVQNSAVGSVLAYIELNPVRAGLCREADDFRWSSAGAHLTKPGEGSLLDLNWWRGFEDAEHWRAVLAETDLCPESLRRATYTGRPFGSEEFVADLEVRLRRKLERRRGGRPRKKDSAALAGQQELFAS